MNNTLEHIKTKPQGHLRIYEKETGKIILDQHNDINAENFSYALATSLVGYPSGNIRYMVFGNGGARPTSSNKYIYSVPQTVGRAASLYNQTFQKDLIINANEDNYMNVSHATGNDYSDIVVHCTLGKEEVKKTLGSDGENGSSVSEQVFSEIGLVTSGGDLITHICFFPIQKSAQSSLIIDYILRIQIV
jgi:hypothetical protein